MLGWVWGEGGEEGESVGWGWGLHGECGWVGGGQTRHSRRWLVLSSRPTLSLLLVRRKSS